MQANPAIICLLFTSLFYHDIAIFHAARRHILTAVHILEVCIRLPNLRDGSGECCVYKRVASNAGINPNLSWQFET